MVTQATLLAFAVVSIVSGQTWNRRAYYRDSNCQGEFAYGIQVYTPISPCQNNGLSLTQSCEVKSTNPLALSSEATGCDSISPESVTEQIWFPEPGQGTLVNSNYLTLFGYQNNPSQPQCNIENGRVQLQQETFAADGRCYAWEPDYYFKASCSGNSGTIIYCR